MTACIIELNDHRRAVDTAAATIALRNLRDWADALAGLDRRAEVASLKARTAQRAARQAMRKHGPTEWTLALYRRRDAASTALSLVLAPRFGMALQRREAGCAVGAALSRLTKAEACRLYALAFPGLSRQKVEWEVSSLLSRHRMDSRRAV